MGKGRSWGAVASRFRNPKQGWVIKGVGVLRENYGLGKGRWIVFKPGARFRGVWPNVFLLGPTIVWWSPEALSHSSPPPPGHLSTVAVVGNKTCYHKVVLKELIQLGTLFYPWLTFQVCGF